MDQDFLGYAPLEKLLLPFRKILTPIMMYKYQNIGIAFFSFLAVKSSFERRQFQLQRTMYSWQTYWINFAHVGTEVSSFMDNLVHLVYLFYFVLINVKTNKPIWLIFVLKTWLLSTAYFLIISINSPKKTGKHLQFFIVIVWKKDLNIN